MKEYKYINGKKFEIMKAINKPTFRFRSRLDSCYDRPSDVKKEIYEDWEYYVRHSFDDFCDFGIESYNVFMFTLGWSTPEGEYYVTKTRQEFYPYK